MQRWLGPGRYLKKKGDQLSVYPRKNIKQVGGVERIKLRVNREEN